MLAQLVTPCLFSRFDDAMRSSVSQDLATLKRRQLNFQQECSQLAERYDWRGTHCTIALQKEVDQDLVAVVAKY